MAKAKKILTEEEDERRKAYNRAKSNKNYANNKQKIRATKFLGEVEHEQRHVYYIKAISFNEDYRDLHKKIKKKTKAEYDALFPGLHDFIYCVVRYFDKKQVTSEKGVPFNRDQISELCTGLRYDEKREVAEDEWEKVEAYFKKHRYYFKKLSRLFYSANDYVFNEESY